MVAVVASPASAAVTAAPNTAAGATTIATAMSAAGFQRTGASYATVPASGSTPNGTSNTAVGGFPSPSGPFGILTTGRVTNVLGAQSVESDIRINDNLTVRGNSARDATVLKIDFTAQPARTA